MGAFLFCLKIEMEECEMKWIDKLDDLIFGEKKEQMKTLNKKRDVAKERATVSLGRKLKGDEFVFDIMVELCDKIDKLEDELDHQEFRLELIKGREQLRKIGDDLERNLMGIKAISRKDD